MRIKLISFAAVIIIAASGCLKDTKQPVSHINDVNVAITGTWTQTAGIIIYYDADGKKLYQDVTPFLNLLFDGNATVNVFENQPLLNTKGSYTITTEDKLDFVNIITGDTTDNFQIALLQARNLKLNKSLYYLDGTTLTVGGKDLIYYKSVQTNSYAKKNLAP